MTQSPDAPGPPLGRPRSRPGDGLDSAATDPDDALIDEIGEESFPASDAPSSWSGPPSESPAP